VTVQMTTLANGLRVISEGRDSVQTTAVGVWVDAGARYETMANNGVAHMLEHMAFKGTESRSAQDIAVEIERRLCLARAYGLFRPRVER